MEFVTTATLTVLHWYKKFISPFLPPACRFFPTCSEYSSLAIRKYGILRGAVLSVKRLSKCHPFHAGGYDPLL